jgi:hypothetical protein
MSRAIATYSVQDVAAQDQISHTSPYMSNAPPAPVPNRNHTRVRTNGRTENHARLRAPDSSRTTTDLFHTSSHTAERCPSNQRSNLQSDISTRQCLRGSHCLRRLLGTMVGFGSAIRAHKRSPSSRYYPGVESDPQPIRLQWCIGMTHGRPRPSEEQLACVRETQTNRRRRRQ